MGTILSSGYLQSVLGTALQTIGVAAKKPANHSNSDAANSVAQQPDGGQPSPFAQLLNTLQQFEQSNPAQYQKVSQKIATNLQTAAQTAQAAGNQTAAKQLQQLSAEFSNSSQTGQVPGIPGHSGSAALSQFISALQTGGATNGSLNPLTIIDNTLSSAGVAL